MEKENKYLIIGAILIAIVLILPNNFELFSILDDTSGWNSELLSSDNLVAEFKSKQPYGQMTYVCYAGTIGCRYTTGIYHLVADTCYDSSGNLLYPEDEPCGNWASKITNTVSITTNSAIANCTIIGKKGESEGVLVTQSQAQAIIIDNKIFNTDFIKNFTFDYIINQRYVGTPKYGENTITFQTKFYLSNSERDILLLDKEGLTISESGHVVIKKNPSGVGYLVNGNQIDIPIGAYKLVVISYQLGSSFVPPNSESYNYLKVNNIIVQNIPQTVDIYRLINNTCEAMTVMNNDVLSTDYYNIEDCQEDISNGTTNNTNGDIYVYRLEDNQCLFKKISPIERLDNDYDNLIKCEENIEEGACVFKLGEYCIKWWMVIVGGLIIIFMINRSPRGPRRTYAPRRPYYPRRRW